MFNPEPYNVLRFRVEPEGVPHWAGAIKTPEAAAAVARTFLGDEPNEVLLLIGLKPNQRISGVTVVHRGTLDACPIGKRELFRAALWIPGTAEIILAHNHPSGSAEPSPVDLSETREIVQVGRFLGIPVQDHIVVGVGTDEWYSIRQHRPEIRRCPAGPKVWFGPDDEPVWPTKPPRKRSPAGLRKVAEPPGETPSCSNLPLFRP